MYRLYSVVFITRFKHILHIFFEPFPLGIYMFKVNNRNTRTRCEICSKLALKTPERCRHLLAQSKHWKYENDVWYLFKVNNKYTKTSLTSGVFIVNFEQISHIMLVFPLFVDSELVNSCSVCLFIEITMQKSCAIEKVKILVKIT